MILVFDTETNGLPKKDDFSAVRIVSIAFKTDSDEKYFIIKPDFEINNSHIHGITYEMATQEGVDFQEAIQYLNSVIDSVDTLVGHNINFDIGVLLSELYRHQEHVLVSKIKDKNKYCTMKNSVMVCKIRDKYGRYKYPKLGELYSHFFNDTCNFHHALEDTRATYKCYNKLKI
jgi:DNA polymerase-3 subunit alpha